MNIMHVITHGGWAGSESIAGAIANEQAKRGNNVSVILRRHESHKESEIRNKFHPSIKIYWVEQKETHPNNQIKTLIKNNLFLDSIKEVDIFHAHLPYGCLLGDLLKQTYHLSFQICVSMHVRYHPLYSLSDKLFTVAKWQTAEIPKDYSGKIFVVENFLCDINHNKEKKLKIFQKKFHINDSTKYIVYLGRLDLVKGPDVLIRAFNKLKPNNYKLIIIGDGPEASSLKKMAGENIIFTGKILDASFILEIADIVAIPSRFESFGLVLLEAINAGKRVIATNIPSFKEILGSEDHLFENENVSSLSAKIEQYINNPTMGFAQDNIKNKFSLSCSMDKLEVAYSIIDLNENPSNLPTTVEESVDELDAVYNV